MANSDTVLCPQFDWKLQEFYRLTETRKDGGKAIKSDVDLASLCEVAKSTVSTWKNGDKSKNRDRFKLKTAHIDILAEEVAACLDYEISKQDAFYLWRFASADEFLRGMRQRKKTSFDALLKTREPSLQVTPRVVDHSSLGMVDEELESLEADFIVKPDSRIVFEIEARKGRTLIVMGHTVDGYYCLVPGPRHDGRVTQSPEIVPRGRPWKLELPSDGGVFYFFECMTSVPRPERERRKPMKLDSDGIKDIVHELLDFDLSGSWRWARVDIGVEKSVETKQEIG